MGIQRADDIRLVNLGFAASFLAIAGLGILQANVAYVSEKPELKRRGLPPLPARGGAEERARPYSVVRARPRRRPVFSFAGIAGTAF